MPVAAGLDAHHDADEQQRACNGKRAHERAQEKDCDEVERHERQIEQRGGRAAREKRADLIEVARALQAIAATGTERQRVLGGEYFPAQVVIEPSGGLAQQPEAKRIEQSAAGVESQHCDREHAERGCIARRQDHVVDLQRVDGAGERQHADRARDRCCGEDRTATAVQGACDGAAHCRRPSFERRHPILSTRPQRSANRQRRLKTVTPPEPRSRKGTIDEARLPPMVAYALWIARLARMQQNWR